ncbi:hypothetical protein IF803_40015 [Bradyrhizobium sp. UFLA06-06]
MRPHDRFFGQRASVPYLIAGVLFGARQAVVRLAQPLLAHRIDKHVHTRGAGRLDAVIHRRRAGPELKLLGVYLVIAGSGMVLRGIIIG